MPEWGAISAEAARDLNDTRQRGGGRIVAVGTTAAAASWKAPRRGAARSNRSPTKHPSSSRPAYRFRAVDVLLTNFHLPRSTLFMLVSAFSGLDTMRRAYAHAIHDGLPLLLLW